MGSEMCIRDSFYPVLDGRSIEEEIRGPDVTRHVSRIAQMPRVREWVNEKVRETANSRNVVVDGRDMGTVVFPDAAGPSIAMTDVRRFTRRRASDLPRSAGTIRRQPPDS